MDYIDRLKQLHSDLKYLIEAVRLGEEPNDLQHTIELMDGIARNLPRDEHEQRRIAAFVAVRSTLESGYQPVTATGKMLAKPVQEGVDPYEGTDTDPDYDHIISELVLQFNLPENADLATAMRGEVETFMFGFISCDPNSSDPFERIVAQKETERGEKHPLTIDQSRRFLQIVNPLTKGMSGSEYGAVLRIVQQQLRPATETSPGAIELFDLNRPGDIESYGILDSANHLIRRIEKTPDVMAYVMAHKEPSINDYKYLDAITPPELKAKFIALTYESDTHGHSGFSYSFVFANALRRIWGTVDTLGNPILAQAPDNPTS